MEELSDLPAGAGRGEARRAPRPPGLLQGEDPLRGHSFHSSAEGWVGAGGERQGWGSQAAHSGFSLEERGIYVGGEAW